MVNNIKSVMDYKNVPFPLPPNNSLDTWNAFRQENMIYVYYNYWMHSIPSHTGQLLIHLCLSCPVRCFRSTIRFMKTDICSTCASADIHYFKEILQFIERNWFRSHIHTVKKKKKVWNLLNWWIFWNDSKLQNTTSKTTLPSCCKVSIMQRNTALGQ